MLNAKGGNAGAGTDCAGNRAGVKGIQYTRVTKIMMAGCDADLRINHAAQASARVELGPVLTSFPPLNPSHPAVTSSRGYESSVLAWVRLENRRDRAGTWVSVGAPAISLSKAPRRRPPRLVLEHARPSSAASLTGPRCLQLK